MENYIQIGIEVQAKALRDHYDRQVLEYILNYKPVAPLVPIAVVAAVCLADKVINDKTPRTRREIFGL